MRPVPVLMAPQVLKLRLLLVGSPVTLMPNVSGTPVNPLVAAGLIPKSLEDLLQVPQRKQGGTRTRVVTKARVITGEEYMEELQKKEREVKEKEEAKQKRKEEREQKRKEKEEEKERKQKIREEKPLKKPKKILEDQEAGLKLQSQYLQLVISMRQSHLPLHLRYAGQVVFAYLP